MMYIYNTVRFRIHLACNAINLSINRSFILLIIHMSDLKIKYVNLILKNVVFLEKSASLTIYYREFTTYLW
jgi:hypothetical protein